MSNVLVIGPESDAERAITEAAFDPLYSPSLADAAQLSEAERGAITAIAYRGHHAFGGAEMDAFPALGLIANFGVGYDAIDTVAASARDVRVTNTPDVLNDDVADLTVLMLLAHERQYEGASRWVRDGNWSSQGAYPLGRKVSGRKVGILGLGRIGRDIADRLAAFKSEIHYFARSQKDTPGWQFHSDPVSLAQSVDYLIVALVGGPDTQNFVSKAVIDALGPNGVLVNISRGSTVDEGALLDALEANTLGGAALDVFLNEPHIDPRFLALDNVSFQPHQGSATVETRAAMAQLQRDNVSAFTTGQALLTPVN
ncbi:2-hydroxyacid dehydrogenase [Litorivicinus lipolyticus]|uniref:2-hydroxyacid dehydrogenase n=1 Tax=Litorivicinus lipolyticus TaxID=418701 RepID=A0A5Q2Q9D9_9GAMM|nr:2-hydroxyacid dehydrogenase [Litorivicinus lipolyticus]QGG79534.1 2-hydroxyacid dehydrogenase [Litorivicinus lipolyticus]